LPNLDFKLVVANTLNSVPEEGNTPLGSLAFATNDPFKDEFHKLTDIYFNVFDPLEKNKLRRKLNN
jgi:hypothetical protein